MKRFIKKIFYFLLPVFIISLPLDFFLSYQLKKSKSYAMSEFCVWNDLLGGKVNADIVIYDSSRAWVHINPQMIEDEFNVPAYNLGIDGHNFWLQLLRHEILLKTHTPKTIILSVDIFTLQKKNDLYNHEQFLPYMLYNEQIKKYIQSYNGYCISDYYLPLVRYAGNRKALMLAMTNIFVKSNSAQGRVKGYIGMDRQWTDDLSIAKAQMDHYKMIHDRKTVELFEKFIIDCKERNINLIFVYTPEYIEGQKYVKNRGEIINLYEDISSKYSIPFIDYSDDELCLNKKYFYNSLHLNKEGSTIFTAKMIKKIKSILLQYEGLTTSEALKKNERRW